MPTKIQVALIALGLGFLAGYMLQPEPELKIVEKVVQQKEIEEKIVIVERKDGTKVTTIDRSSKERTQTDKLTHKTPAKKDWKVGIGRHISKDIYTVSASRRVLGDIYVGIQADQHGSVIAQVEILF